jgi:hypothetical protein
MPSLPPRKTSSIISSLDDFERRDDIMRACGAIVLVILAASFALDLIVVMDFSRPYQIAQFSQDEYWFMEEIYKLQEHLLALDWGGIRSFGSPFAYGFPFWLFAAVIALPFHGHVMLMALFLRLVFTATKYAALYIVYRRIYVLTQKPLLSALALGLLLIIPAYVFDGKIIGPEYLIMLLIALGWSSLLSLRSSAGFVAAFCFAYALAIKVNVAPLTLIFLPVLFTYPANERGRLLLSWAMGAILPLLLFFIPQDPFKEILAIGSTHHVDYGLQYLPVWYGYNALEFDDMLKGGWKIDFITWPLFGVFVVYSIWQSTKWLRARPVAISARGWASFVMPALICTFFAAVITCFLTSLNSLMHPWFVFAPFLLLMASGILLVGVEREGKIVMIIFIFVYIVCFGGRYVLRWEHRIDKFEYVAATEQENAAVAGWIEENCPKARGAVIDYNLIWPPTYNGHLQNTWTLIEVEDYRRANGDAYALLDKTDLLLLKSARVNAFSQLSADAKVPGAILGNFFPDAPPYFIRQHDFPQLSVYAREGVCKKQGK